MKSKLPCLDGRLTTIRTWKPFFRPGKNPLCLAAYLGKNKSVVISVYVFRECCWRYFFINYESILVRINQVLERHAKTALRKVMEAGTNARSTPQS